MYLCHKHWRQKMKEKSRYFVLKQKAVPEVLLKVVDAKRLLESGKAASVQACYRYGGHQQKFFL